MIHKVRSVEIIASAARSDVPHVVIHNPEPAGTLFIRNILFRRVCCIVFLFQDRRFIALEHDHAQRSASVERLVADRTQRTGKRYRLQPGARKRPRRKAHRPVRSREVRSLLCHRIADQFEPVRHCLVQHPADHAHRRAHVVRFIQLRADHAAVKDNIRHLPERRDRTAIKRIFTQCKELIAERHFRNSRFRKREIADLGRLRKHKFRQRRSRERIISDCIDFVKIVRRCKVVTVRKRALAYRRPIHESHRLQIRFRERIRPDRLDIRKIDVRKFRSRKGIIAHRSDVRRQFHLSKGCAVRKQVGRNLADFAAESHRRKRIVESKRTFAQRFVFDRSKIRRNDLRRRTRVSVRRCHQLAVPVRIFIRRTDHVVLQAQIHRPRSRERKGSHLFRAGKIDRSQLRRVVERVIADLRTVAQRERGKQAVARKRIISQHRVAPDRHFRKGGKHSRIKIITIVIVSRTAAVRIFHRIRIDRIIAAEIGQRVLVCKIDDIHLHRIKERIVAHRDIVAERDRFQR